MYLKHFTVHKCGSEFSFVLCLSRCLMLGTAQRPMECTTTSVTTSSMLPTKATWGNKAHRHTYTHAHLNYLLQRCSLLFNFTPVPPPTLVPLPICPSMYLITTLPLRLPWLDPLSHLSVCALSLKAVSDTLLPVCLSVSVLAPIISPVSEAVDPANKHTFIRPAQRRLTFSAKS